MTIPRLVKNKDKSQTSTRSTVKRTCKQTKNYTSRQITKQPENHANSKAEETIKVFDSNFPAGNFQLQFLKL